MPRCARRAECVGGARATRAALTRPTPRARAPPRARRRAAAAPAPTALRAAATEHGLSAFALRRFCARGSTLAAALLGAGAEGAPAADAADAERDGRARERARLMGQLGLASAAEGGAAADAAAAAAGGGRAAAAGGGAPACAAPSPSLSEGGFTALMRWLRGPLPPAGPPLPTQLLRAWFALLDSVRARAPHRRRTPRRAVLRVPRARVWPRPAHSPRRRARALRARPAAARAAAPQDGDGVMSAADVRGACAECARCAADEAAGEAEQAEAKAAEAEAVASGIIEQLARAHAALRAEGAEEAAAAPPPPLALPFAHVARSSALARILVVECAAALLGLEAHWAGQAGQAGQGGRRAEQQAAAGSEAVE